MLALRGDTLAAAVGEPDRNPSAAALALAPAAAVLHTSLVADTP